MCNRPSLDRVTDRFNVEPNLQNGRTLLTIAGLYWKDEMISDKTYYCLIKRVVMRLKGQY